MSAGERLERATAIEGHPDNVAACLLGGLVVCYRVAAGLRAERLEPHPELHPVALVPEDQRLSTEAARRSLPSQVPFADAVHTAGRAALAVLAFTGRPDLLADALDDRLHERHRMELAPASGAVLRGLRDEGIPACVSGAGPALLAFPPAGRTIENLPSGWRARPLDVAVRGASILAS